jgi:succinate dehydrogenase/fumarate reductase flavoprotein subunit
MCLPIRADRSHSNTGDGYLLAAEAGAELSGMEFSIQYTMSPAGAATRTLLYGAARYYDAHGAEIVQPTLGHAHYQAIGAALLKGPVYADLTDAPPELRPILQDIEPFTRPRSRARASTCSANAGRSRPERTRGRQGEGNRYCWHPSS